MEAVLESIGFNGTAVIFSTVNFLIVLVILQKTLFGRVGKSLSERKEKIRKSLEDAERVEAKMNAIEEERATIIKNANREASDIVQSHTEQAEAQAKTIKEEAQVAADKITEEGKMKVEKERSDMVDRLKKETADLAILATEKIIEEKLDAKKDKAVIEKYLKDVK